MILKKIKILRKKFKIDGYIIPKNDETFSEYAKNDRLKKITNFSGSAQNLLSFFLIHIYSHQKN